MQSFLLESSYAVVAAFECSLVLRDRILFYRNSNPGCKCSQYRNGVNVIATITAYFHVYHFAVPYIFIPIYTCVHTYMYISYALMCKHILETRELFYLSNFNSNWLQLVTSIDFCDISKIYKNEAIKFWRIFRTDVLLFRR